MFKLKLPQIEYLRLSVTDRCNLRCSYCLGKSPPKFIPHKDLLSFQEIIYIIKILREFGIKKLRITGGEPLLRRDLSVLIRKLNLIEGIEEISLTTNGVLLEEYALALKSAGVKRVNVSLDTLNREKFQKITGADNLDKVLAGIKKAKEAGFTPVKINVVLMRTVNEDEVENLVDFAVSSGVVVRFIEFMRLSPFWQRKYFIPLEEIITRLMRKFPLKESYSPGSGPAQYYSVGNQAVIGFIKTKEATCAKCTRLRLTALGLLKICLYEERGVSLLKFIREGVGQEHIKKIIARALSKKRYISCANWQGKKVYLSQVGG